MAVQSSALLLIGSISGLDVHIERPAAARWSRTQCGGPSGAADVPSVWAKHVSPVPIPLPEYPRPMMVRSSTRQLSQRVDRTGGDASTWMSLNGLWEWEADPAPDGSPAPVGRNLSGSILVPFPVESCLSGVAPNSSKAVVQRMWYRLQLHIAPGPPDTRTLLHFDAVDWQAAVWVNGNLSANHTGSADRFSVDLTDAILAAAPTRSPTLQPPVLSPACGLAGANVTCKQVELLVSVYDPSDEGAQPNGKQRISAISNPGGDTYTPSSGIWQTVWLERVPASYVESVRVNADASGLLTASAKLIQGGDPVETVDYEVIANGQVLATATAPPGATVSLQVPSPRLWSPASPALYDLRVTAGADTVLGYFGMRSFSVGHESGAGAEGVVRPLLNGEPIFLAGWLDQSYWPDGQYTAPTDAALRSDLEAVSTFGYNTVRLHQKVNPERWYLHADQLGVLVTQDAIQKYGHATAATVPYFEADMRAMIKSRGNHPCIVQWTVFNEYDCWHPFTAPGHTVADVVALARATDWQGRPVDTDSGGDANSQPQGDVNDVHSYPYPSHPKPTSRKYAMVGEYGGIGAFLPGKEWVPHKCHAYKGAATPAEEASIYIQMARMLLNWTANLSAAIYTQIADVELECDGFLNYDRSPKFDASTTKAIADANRALIASVKARARPTAALLAGGVAAS